MAHSQDNNKIAIPTQNRGRFKTDKHCKTNHLQCLLSIPVPY